MVRRWGWDSDHLSLKIALLQLLLLVVFQMLLCDMLSCLRHQVPACQLQPSVFKLPAIQNQLILHFMSSNKKTTPNCASAKLVHLSDRNCVCAFKAKFSTGTHESKHIYIYINVGREYPMTYLQTYCHWFHRFQIWTVEFFLQDGATGMKTVWWVRPMVAARQVTLVTVTTQTTSEQPLESPARWRPWSEPRSRWSRRKRPVCSNTKSQ